MKHGEDDPWKFFKNVIRHFSSLLKTMIEIVLLQCGVEIRCVNML